MNLWGRTIERTAQPTNLPTREPSGDPSGDPARGGGSDGVAEGVEVVPERFYKLTRPLRLTPGEAASIELRFDQKLNLRYLSGYQLYAFVDSGVAWNDGYRLSDGLSLTSAGGGVRFIRPGAGSSNGDKPAGVQAQAIFAKPPYRTVKSTPSKS